MPFTETGKIGKEQEFRSREVGNEAYFIHIITSYGILYMFLYHLEAVTFQLNQKRPKSFWQIYIYIYIYRERERERERDLCKR